MGQIKSPLKSLTKNRVTIGEILSCCPFDKNKNLDGNLTKEIFFDHLFVQTDYYEELSGMLTDCITSDLENIRLLLLDGFAGNGKTTFLRNYLRINKDRFYCEYIDFHEYVRDADVSDRGQLLSRSLGKMIDRYKEEKERYVADKDAKPTSSHLDFLVSLRSTLIEEQNVDNPISSIIKGYLSDIEPEDELLDCLYFTWTNRARFSKYLSKNLIDRINTLESGSLSDLSHDIINNCDLSDAFILFFIHSFLHHTRKKIVLIVFDNLDAVNIDFLATHFANSFGTILSTAQRLSQDRVLFPEPVYFSSRYKFVFCLRDGNAATLNAHIADSLGHTIKALAYSFRFNSGIYSSIVSKRTQFFATIIARRAFAGRKNLKYRAALEVAKTLEALAQDRYFRETIVPMFNFDFRKLTLALFDAVKEALASKRKGAIDSIKGLEHAGGDRRFGSRGILAFHIIKRLKEQNYLADYPFFMLRSDERGYCLHSRMVLSVLLNNSGLDRGEMMLRSKFILKASSLSDLIDQCGGVYSADEVSATVQSALSFHYLNWTHLVSVRFFPAEKQPTIPVLLRTGDASGGDAFDEGTYRALFGDWLITLTPAGFVYLKDILPHFEFYSALVGSESSLFSVRLQHSHATNYAYKFEEIISGVFRLVTLHIEEMKKFYVAVVKKLFESDEHYLASSFAFRHFFTGRPADVGVFHASRIVLSHLEYLDTYRILLLRSLTKIQKKNKMVALDAILSLWMSRYVQLVADLPDRAAGLLRTEYLEALNKSCSRLRAGDEVVDRIVPATWYQNALAKLPSLPGGTPIQAEFDLS